MITIYSTPTCAFCHAAKQYLTGLKIPFTPIDVTEEPDGVEKLIHLSGQTGVPVIDIDGTIIIGFNRPQLDAVLRANKLM
jgi:glutaredoxin 3